MFISHKGEEVKITIECKTPIENLIIYADIVSKDHVGQWKEQNGLALDHKYIVFFF